MTPVELKRRTQNFALRILHLVDSMPNTKSARIIANQLGRCGTSISANYRAACKGRSPAEFVAKVGIVEEEADESVFWLELIIEGAIITKTRVKPLLEKATEITAIMGASRITASKNLRTKNRQSAIGNRQ